MGDLLTEYDLKKTGREDDVALLARAQTLTVVGRLDARRKGDVVRFLYGAGLINKDSTIVDLRGADLSGVYLDKAHLSDANLFLTNLRGAHLSRADLSVADLSWADLRGAFLGAVLPRGDRVSLSGAAVRDATDKALEVLVQRANSLEGATMPNGQKYEDWLKSREEDKENDGSS